MEITDDRSQMTDCRSLMSAVYSKILLTKYLVYGLACYALCCVLSLSKALHTVITPQSSKALYSFALCPSSCALRSVPCALCSVLIALRPFKEQPNKESLIIPQKRIHPHGPFARDSLSFQHLLNGEANNSKVE